MGSILLYANEMSNGSSQEVGRCHQKDGGWIRICHYLMGGSGACF